jgi:hypothetical protein
MKKLNLKIEDLRIESFSTAAVDGERGTVHGEQISAAGSCFCTRHECVAPSQPGYVTYVNNICIRC